MARPEGPTGCLEVLGDLSRWPVSPTSSRGRAGRWIPPRGHSSITPACVPTLPTDSDAKLGGTAFEAMLGVFRHMSQQGGVLCPGPRTGRRRQEVPFGPHPWDPFLGRLLTVSFPSNKSDHKGSTFLDLGVVLANGQNRGRHSEAPTLASGSRVSRGDPSP